MGFKKIISLHILFLLTLGYSLAQNENDSRISPLLDSLMSVLDREKIDTITAEILHDIAYEYKYVGENETARKYIYESLAMCNQLNWQKGRAKAFNVIADSYLNVASYDTASIYFERAIEISDSFNLKSALASSYLNYSNLFSEKSDYPTALHYLLSCLNIVEELKDEHRIGGSLINIGIIYFYQNELDTALHYFERSLQIYKRRKDTQSLSFVYTNIGAVYANQDKLTKSLHYFRQAAKTKKELNEMNGLCIVNQNIAEISNHLSTIDEDSLHSMPEIYKYADLNNLQGSLRDSAKLYLNRAIEIANEINSNYNILSSLSTLGNIYVAEKEYGNAIDTYKRGIKMAEELKTGQYKMDIYKNLYQVFEETHEYDSALHYYKLFAQQQDSLFSKEKQQEIGKYEAEYAYEKEKALKEAEYQKQLALDKEELKRQKLVQWFLGIILFIIAIVAIVIYRALRISRKRKAAIEDQKEIIEKKNLEILSSIRYASRIQNALLKEEESVTPELPNHFIFFRPRDIVSGDFYWSVKQDEQWYLAVADCTGHGVPGAFLTMLGTAYLNEILGTDIQTTPDIILNELREKIVNQLSQSENVDDSKDGMDISLISINLKTLEAEWAGANNPIYIVRKKQDESDDIMTIGDQSLLEIKGDKQPIGFHSRQQPFTSHKYQFQKGDSFYLISDGFADQFGGPRNKKYRYRPLKELILKSSSGKIEEQKKIFSEEFDNWKGDNDQLDDVCLIGVKL